MKNLDLYVKNFSVSLSKLSSSTVRGTFWSRIAFCKKNHHFQTLSKTLSTFCQNHFGRIVITAIYITSGAFIWKELFFEKSVFFHHLPTLRRNSLDFCWANFGMDFKTAFFLAERTAWGRKFYIPKKIFDHCDTMSEEIQLFGKNFWHGFQISFLRVRTIFLRKTYTLKNLDRINFFWSFWSTSLNSVPKVFGACYQKIFCPFLIFIFWGKKSSAF